MSFACWRRPSRRSRTVSGATYWRRPIGSGASSCFLLRQAVAEAAQAEACCRQALAVARRQRARSWELRAATSLGRLWQQHGKGEAARQLLVEVYDRFTEGFDTADLQEARAVLEMLRT
jgi:predicted ATPase